MRRHYFLSILLLFPLMLTAQDKISLLNSKEIINIKVTDVTANTIRFQQAGKDKAIYREKVFGINYENGTEKIIYMPDPNEDDFEIEEMRLFLKGTRDAKKHYHNTASTVVGLIAGIAGPVGFFDPKGFLPFASMIPLPSAFGILIMTMGSPNMNRQKHVEKKYLNNEEYLMGYQRKARRKKTRNAFLGSLVGMGIGMIIMKDQIK